MIKNIAIIGAGSWGTALAMLLGGKGADVTMWAFEKDVVEGINASGRNPLYLDGFDLPPTVCATTDLRQAISGREMIVSVVPSHALRSVWGQGAKYMDENSLLVSCTKGIEASSLKLMSQVLSDCLPDHPESNRVVLSGPSFAAEVASGLLTSVVIAGKDIECAKRVQEAFHTDFFLAFTNDDVTGVEVGGAVKNIIAIAAGISEGMGLGSNARAAIITRGLYEMIKIGKALGANPLTLAGLSGIGDLALTCTDKLSRNHEVGIELGRGRSISEITDGMKMVAEGVPTTDAIHRLAQKYGINLPICEMTYNVIHEGLDPRDAVKKLCSMKLTTELGSILK
jgi:glycerol-3-phosphate dehydrogenase (NAD(P)+)